MLILKPIWGPDSESVTNDKLNQMVEYAEQNGGGSPSGGGAGGIALTATLTTASLAASAIDSTKTIALGRALLLSKITLSRPAWVRLYPTAADRASDLNRGRADDPAEGVTVSFDFALDNPTVLSDDTPNVSITHAAPSPTALFATVINLSNTIGTVAVTFNFLQLQPYEI